MIQNLNDGIAAQEYDVVSFFNKKALADAAYKKMNS